MYVSFRVIFGALDGAVYDWLRGPHIQGSRLQSTLLVMDEHGRRTSRGLSVSIRAGEIRASVVSLASAGEFKASVSFHCHRLKYGP